MRTCDPPEPLGEQPGPLVEEAETVEGIPVGGASKLEALGWAQRNLTGQRAAAAGDRDLHLRG